MAKTPFGAEILSGDSLSLFLEVRQYFLERRGVEITAPYFYSTEVGKEFSISLNEYNLKHKDDFERAVCSEKLFRFDHDDKIKGCVKEQTLVSQKKHLIFKTCDGDEIKTCYGISRCLSKRGFSLKEVDEDSFAIKTLPDVIGFDEFIDREVNYDDILLESSVFDLREASEVISWMDRVYGEDVLPFIRKWSSVTLCKENAARFLEEFESVNSTFLSMFKPKFRPQIRKRILTYVGIEI